jgi:hypothetical protein
MQLILHSFFLFKVIIVLYEKKNNQSSINSYSAA